MKTTQKRKDRPRYRRPSYPFHARGLALMLAPGIVVDSHAKQYADLLQEADRNRGGRSNHSGSPASMRFRNDDNFFLCWPPNLFAFTSLFLGTTGAYARLLSGDDNWPEWPPTQKELLEAPNKTFGKLAGQGRSWALAIDNCASDWRCALDKYPLTQLLKALVPLIPRSNFTDKPEEQHGALADALRTAFPKMKPKRSGGDPVTVACELDALSDGKGIERLAAFVEHCVPGVVRELWALVQAEMHPPRETDADDIWKKELRHVFVAIMTLHALADRACTGWGIRRLAAKLDSATTLGSPQSQAQDLARMLLSRTGSMALLAHRRGRVLPKRHTPEVGVTLRGMSSSVTFHRSAIDVEWITDAASVLTTDLDAPRSKAGASLGGSRRGTISVLLLPWPLVIAANDFEQTRWMDKEGVVKTMATFDPFNAAAGFFAYRPDPSFTQHTADSDVKRLLPSILAFARNQLKCPVDLVVLPEMAIEEGTRPLLERVMKEGAVRAFLSGVRQNKGSEKPDENEVALGLLEPNQRDFTVKKYSKHHRWRLTGPQIRAYNLGSRLHPSFPYWEDIRVWRKKAIFGNLGDELTICPVICEDLARQDAMADLIRSVGPSLMVAVLMDGPQLRDRWAANYASVYGEDPGCAVLTITSLGLVDTWRREGKSEGGSRVVALWSDRDGSKREITLDDGAVGILLHLAVVSEPEGTIDGRKASIGTFNLSWAAEQQIYETDVDGITSRRRGASK